MTDRHQAVRSVHGEEPSGEQDREPGPQEVRNQQESGTPVDSTEQDGRRGDRGDEQPGDGQRGRIAWSPKNVGVHARLTTNWPTNAASAVVRARPGGDRTTSQTATPCRVNNVVQATANVADGG